MLHVTNGLGTWG